jgi:hypothetical protein
MEVIDEVKTKEDPFTYLVRGVHILRVRIYDIFIVSGRAKIDKFPHQCGKCVCFSRF